MHALIIGATGATGKDLLELLLGDPEFSKVSVFVRRATLVQHPKLTEHVIDFDKPLQWKQLVKGDVLFSCLGTTLKAAGSKMGQWKVDHDYQLEFAKAARENEIKKYVLVSAELASVNSIFFYSRMKGQLENNIKQLNFEQTFIVRPPLLIRKQSDRTGENFSVRAIHFLNNLGLMRSARPLDTRALAEAMVLLAKSSNARLTILSGQEIRKFLQQ